MEKWLLEVQDTMIISIRDVIRQSVNAYAVTPRKQWVIEWPGQVAICVSSIYWTTEVTEAIAVPNGMAVRYHISQFSSYGCSGAESRAGT